MTTIALLGAGGKMGFRLSANRRGSPFTVRHVEVAETGRARLGSELGIDCVDENTALTGADVVVLAVPDTLIGRISHAIERRLARRHDGHDPRPRGTVRRRAAGAARPRLLRWPRKFGQFVKVYSTV